LNERDSERDREEEDEARGVLLLLVVTLCMTMVGTDFTTVILLQFSPQSSPQSLPSLLHCSRNVDISAVKTVRKDDIDLDLSHALPVEGKFTAAKTVDSNSLLATRSLNGFFLVLRRLFDSMFARVRQVKVLTKTKI